MTNKLYLDDILSNFENPTLLSEEGGQKIVFTVTLPDIGLSVLKIGRYNSEAGLERIRREVGILRDLNSDYFPRNYGFEIVDHERYFILEEYLVGKTLNEHITNYSSEKLATDLVLELVIALRILWSKRIVHRDLKPQNIIITKDGPRIIDLGIARLLDETSITKTWAPSGPGTPAYASPEQIENRKRDIDFRSDQFNLGIIFAQLILSGHHPFSPDLVGNRNSILENILSGTWAREVISQRVSIAAMKIIDKLLGKEPFKRYRKAEELQLDLVKLKGG
jgi:serine/threonine-protein kinase